MELIYYEDPIKREKYHKRKAKRKALSVVPTFFLFMITLITTGQSMYSAYDYPFSLEAKCFEYIAFGLWCLLFMWIAKSIIRYKKLTKVSKFLTIFAFSLVSIFAVLMLNTINLHLYYFPLIAVLHKGFMECVLKDLLSTEFYLWARYPCVLITTTVLGYFITSDFFESLPKKINESKFIKRMSAFGDKHFGGVREFFIKYFSVDESCYIVETESNEKKAPMLYITGDTHGQMSFFADCCKFANTDDYVAICGDFGFLFTNDSKENEFLDFLVKTAPYTILFVDGNHENFEAINSYPVEEWNGGKIHRIRKNIIHLMRGQVYTVEGMKIFTMGGAYSVDRGMRQKDVSYWEEELPDDAEYKEATKNLLANGNEVDIILTHTGPKEMIMRLGYEPYYYDAELTGFLDWVLHEVKFKKWYFGHFHQDKSITPECRQMYTDVAKVSLGDDRSIEEEIIAT